jgi:hypothetical protein
MKALPRKMLYLLVFLGTLGVSGAKAQLGNGVHFKMSTAFVAGDATFPEGDYRIRRAPGNHPNLLILSNAQGTNSVFLACKAIKGKGPAEKTVLIFHRYDKTLYLNKIWRAHNTGGILLPVGPPEETDMKNGEPKEESVSGTEE